MYNTEVLKFADSLFTHFGRRAFFYDHPYCYRYTALVNVPGINKKTVTSSGVSFFSDREAKLKCIMEGFERYSQYTFKDHKKNMIKSSYKKISKQKNALNPFLFKRFSELQLKNKKFSKYLLKKSTPFRWISGFDLLNQKPIYIPAQLVFLNYPHLAGENVIEDKISTGASAGPDLEFALRGGICEGIERDAFVIHYYNKLTPPEVDLNSVKDKKIQSILNAYHSYGLKVRVFDIRTEIGVPTFLCALLDDRKTGLPMMLGMKTHLFARDAFLGAIEEVTIPHPWIRMEYLKHHYKTGKVSNLRLVKRSRKWFEDIDTKFDFLFKKRERKIKFSTIKSYKNDLHTLIQLLSDKEIRMYYVDITPKQLSNSGLKFIKAVSPDLVPLSFKDKYLPLGPERLYNVPIRLGYISKRKKLSEFNNYPHPFL